MATAFASRITSLRKEKGLSQKEVAMSLGVSQALLSHYEKGVRECGLDFVVRCAEYFGVTTDYLLGRQESKYGVREDVDDLQVLNAVGKDEKIDMQQLLICMDFLAENFSPMDSVLGDKLLWLLAIVEYKILVCGINSGRFKPEWFTAKPRSDDLIFQKIADAVWTGLFIENSEPVNATTALSGKPFPQFCNNLINSVEDYVEQIAVKYINCTEQNNSQTVL